MTCRTHLALDPHFRVVLEAPSVLAVVRTHEREAAIQPVRLGGRAQQVTARCSLEREHRIHVLPRREKRVSVTRQRRFPKTRHEQADARNRAWAAMEHVAALKEQLLRDRRGLLPAERELVVPERERALGPQERVHAQPGIQPLEPPHPLFRVGQQGRCRVTLSAPTS
eukprot:3935545-Rhodomonas_salina.3